MSKQKNSYSCQFSSLDINQKFDILEDLLFQQISKQNKQNKSRTLATSSNTYFKMLIDIVKFRQKIDNTQPLDLQKMLESIDHSN